MIYSRQLINFVFLNIKTKIGERIKELREISKMSQKDLAYTSDLDRSYIASVENGQRNISIVNIEKIAQALDISLKDFFETEIFENTRRN